MADFDKLFMFGWTFARDKQVLCLLLCNSIRFLDIPYYHHEKWDSSGYPNGLKGAQIPLAARIFAIGDVWDALTSNRCYQKAWPREKVLAHLREQYGKHFDPQVVRIFLKQIS